MTRRSIKSIAAKAQAQDTADRKKANITTGDSFVNFAQKMGVGADNQTSSGSYGFNPITRIRTLLEWIHRGSWLGGVAVDVVADDMTREGIEINGTLDPSDIDKLHKSASRLQMWSHIRDTIAWARLYGGAIAVILVEGQDPSTPLRIETVGKKQFRGLLVLDRWMVEPSLGNLVTELGPNLGLPKFYNIRTDAPALPNMKIHYSRCIRLIGIRLPYWQQVAENLWGISVLERVYDRMLAFDSATTGAAQLVYKSYIRTYQIEGMRDIVAAGGPPLDGLVSYVEIMRRFQNLEGITLMDAKDKFEGHSHGSFAGLSDALTQFGQQISGALQVPLVRLFGQSPAGFSTGETDVRNYYDGIKQQQERELGEGVDIAYRVLAASESITLPEDFGITFKPLWQLSDEEKATIASTVATSVGNLETSGTIDKATALRELKQSSRVTGIFSNITDEQIEDAEGEMAPDVGGMNEKRSGKIPKESESGSSVREETKVNSEASRPSSKGTGSERNIQEES